MQMDSSTDSEVDPLAPKLWSVDEYHQMIEAGILDEDDRVELVEGVIVPMSPQSKLHARIARRLTYLFIKALGEEYVVRPQMPLTLPPSSEPEPDLAISTLVEEDAATAHPTRALLVIEVSKTSLPKDRTTKGRVYARSDVPEYWVVDVSHHQIEVYTEPDVELGKYRSMRTVGEGDTLTASHVAGAPALKLSELFG